MNSAESKIALQESIDNKNLVLRESCLLTLVLELLETSPDSIEMLNWTQFTFKEPLSAIDEKRLSGLGFDVQDLTARSSKTLTEAFQLLGARICRRLYVGEVGNIVINAKSGNITGVVNNVAGCDCGFLEDYA
jgi:hypothetical protein